MDGFAVRNPLTVFCGKGGVGKTTLSLSLGLWYAGRGSKTVVVSSHPLSELAVGVSLQGMKETCPRAAENLFVIHIDPREILAGKIRQQIPSNFLAQKILTHHLYRNLVEVAPGLKEIAFLARLKQIAERQGGEASEGYEFIIWDAPATGHFLQTLRVAHNFESYLSGPFAVIGTDLRRFFSDSANLRLVPVTTPEEMAVEETLDLCRDLESQAGMRPHTVICNLSSPLTGMPESEFEKLCAKLEPVQGDAVRFVLDRCRGEAAMKKRLQAAISCGIRTLPRIANWNSDLELLLSLGEKLAPCLEAR
jgi:anion-transporting  ArsA/GET3 family ATPase